MCSSRNGSSSGQNNNLLFTRTINKKTLVLELEQKMKSLEAAYAASSQEHIISNLRN